MGDPICLQVVWEFDLSRTSRSIVAELLFGLCCLVLFAACGLTSHQRVLYDSSGIQVGIMTDLSTDEGASPPVKNRHPTDLTPRDIRSLIGSLEVSGWSGIVVGLFSNPQPKPLFTEAEILLLAEPLGAAFKQATPRERVFFSIENPNATYDTDRTSGSFFFRDDYFHVILTDHYAFLKADPGGGEKRDLRDTKGMKLWVVGPARAATLPEDKTPHWTAFEKVHISLKPRELLAGQQAPQMAADSARSQVALPVAGQSAVKAETPRQNSTEHVDDLHLQIRELTNANQDLRGQLKEQSGMIEKLKTDLEQLRSEMPAGQQKPVPKPKPSRQQTIP